MLTILKSRSFNFLESSGPVRCVMGLLYLYSVCISFVFLAVAFLILSTWSYTIHLQHLHSALASITPGRKRFSWNWYLLTPNWFAASQKIPRISRNPKVHYRTHKRPPPVSILGQPNPVHIPTSWRSVLISTHLCLGLPSGQLPSGFPTKTLYTSLSSLIRTTCPAHLILLNFITHTILGEEYKPGIDN